MALTVNTDTYITQANATTYISQNYASTDTKVTSWGVLSSDNKDVYLRKAAKIIDRLPLVGVKALSTQTMQFPRAIYTDDVFYETQNTNLLHGDNWIVQSETPDEVTYAQVEIALDLMTGVSDRVQLQREGVKSFSLGKLSENYGAGRTGAVGSLPFEAKEYLKPYLLGGARIG